jgi:ABC-type branched-subunit amino acid transport system ATPase component
VTDLPAHERARLGMGYIPQAREIFPDLSVEQNLQVIRDMADRCYAMERGTLVDQLDGDALADEDALAEYLAVSPGRATSPFSAPPVNHHRVAMTNSYPL